MLDDLADFLFTVMVGFFLFFFLNGVLQQDVEAKQRLAEEQLDGVLAEELLLSYLHAPVAGEMRETYAGLIEESAKDGESLPRLKEATKQEIEARGNPLLKGIVLERDGERVPVYFSVLPSQTSEYASLTLASGTTVHLYGKQRTGEGRGFFRWEVPQ